MSETLKDLDLSTPPEPKTPTSKKDKDDVKDKPKDAAQALSSFPDGPTKETLEKWKEQFGEVRVSGFSPVELFVFRSLSREEYTNLQLHIKQSENEISQLDIEEKICDLCSLWASEQALESLNKKAGTLSSLHEQIMQASNFMDPRYAGTYVVRL